MNFKHLYPTPRETVWQQGTFSPNGFISADVSSRYVFLRLCMHCTRFRSMKVMATSG